MVTLYTVFSFKTRQTIMNLIQPVCSHIGRQVSLFHMLEGGASPLQGRFHIPALVLIVFCHLDMSIDMTVRGCFLPEPQGFIKVAASLLQDGQALHGQAEV